ncbi:16S rRNA (cytosine(1402)-N(4))-methyltransferase RsmH [Marinoscillum sp. MHG1-6]|uniref:16S rRNA (cytosine(1402)-N(4))-methyltransferase RsmH n=1 Tax=Marinoscillum sp. MHG1-6 TaxID=2959627 RepID=UPI0021575EF0|nr:16S rRNA (cytosine(1402)-N(4))-methyltransferase RsmH [Marinoscillum sp. MHG1-6]
MSEYHVPVMLKECLEGLDIRPDGSYVDVTFGGGGHSREILKNLDSGHLFAFDQDDDAKANAQSLKEAVGQSRSFTFIESNFRYISKYLRFHKAGQVDGILADLGVSSHQLDEGSRGFSTRFDGDLDMRMDRSSSVTAANILNEYDESDLIHILSAYGEIKNARTLASGIIKSRHQPFTRIQQLKDIALKVAPRGKEMKYLAQLFQAIRIEVNDEMGALKEFLEQTAEVLKPGGRLVIMSYHSLEDRPVKNFMNTGNFKGIMEKDFFGHEIRPFKPLNKKPITPAQDEIDANSRARSAKLRVAVKI